MLTRKWVDYKFYYSMKQKVKQHVKAGAKLLDKEAANGKGPWWERISIENLVMNDGVYCILGQTFGDFGNGCTLLNISSSVYPSDKIHTEKTVADLGFDIDKTVIESLDDKKIYYDYLKQTWLKEINSRRRIAAWKKRLNLKKN